jgi:hypothetical protein
MTKIFLFILMLVSFIFFSCSSGIKFIDPVKDAKVNSYRPNFKFALPGNIKSDSNDFNFQIQIARDNKFTDVVIDEDNLGLRPQDKGNSKSREFLFDYQISKPIKEGSYFIRLKNKTDPKKTYWSDILSFSIITPVNYDFLIGNKVEKITSDGDEIGSYNLSEDYLGSYYNDIFRLKDGSYYLLLNYFNPGGQSAVIMYFTKENDVIWKKEYQSVNYSSAVIDSKENLVICFDEGYENKNEKQKVLMKFNKEGKIENSKSFEEIHNIIFKGSMNLKPVQGPDKQNEIKINSINAVKDDKYLLTGYEDFKINKNSKNIYNYAGFVILLDNNMNVLWKKLYFEKNSYQINRSIETKNGYAVIGFKIRNKDVEEESQFENRYEKDIVFSLLDKSTGAGAEVISPINTDDNIYTIQNIIDTNEGFIASARNILLFFDSEGELTTKKHLYNFFYKNDEYQENYFIYIDKIIKVDNDSYIMYMTNFYEMSNSIVICKADINSDKIFWHKTDNNNLGLCRLFDFSIPDEEMSTYRDAVNITENDLINKWTLKQDEISEAENKGINSFYFILQGEGVFLDPDPETGSEKTGTWNFDQQSGYIEMTVDDSPMYMTVIGKTDNYLILSGKSSDDYTVYMADNGK